MGLMNNTITMHESHIKVNETASSNFIESSINDILCVTLPSHLCTFTVILVVKLFADLSHTCMENNCVPNTCSAVQRRKGSIFLREFMIIIVPLLLLTTVMSGDISSVIVILVGIITVFIFRVFRFHYDSTNFGSYNVRTILKLPIHDVKRSFVTCCRSLVNIVTVIAILAVDFSIFPRRFSKTETYGISLMDVGVGFFILSNAAVLKLEKVISQGFSQCLSGSLVLFIIGLLRCYSVKEINYGVNVSEYGVHWNFFFTLGIVRLLGFVILKIFYSQVSLSGIVLCILHQSLLSFGLEEYVLGNTPRENLIDANREGLVSALGYTSLYLIGVSLNKFIVKTSTNVWGDIKSIAKLAMIALILLVTSLTLSPYFSVCRRLVSLTYITWVLTLAAVHVAVAMFIELIVICFVAPSTIKNKFYNFLTPVILDAVNNNGLVFFLLGNILTGLVNISFDTMKLSKLQSVFILIAYMIINCVVVTIMYFKQIVFRFW